MQIILTKEEYDALLAKPNNSISDYQRRFRAALGNEIIGISKHTYNLSVGDLKGAIERAEKSAEKIPS